MERQEIFTSLGDALRELDRREAEQKKKDAQEGMKFQWEDPSDDPADSFDDSNEIYYIPPDARGTINDKTHPTIDVDRKNIKIIILFCVISIIIIVLILIIIWYYRRAKIPNASVSKTSGSTSG